MTEEDIIKIKLQIIEQIILNFLQERKYKQITDKLCDFFIDEI